MARDVMGLGDIISQSFKEYGENWKVFLGILIVLSFIPSIIFFIVEIFWLKALSGLTLTGDPTKIVSGFFGPLFFLLVLVGVIMFIITIWMQASIIYNVIYKKKSMGFKESVLGSRKYFWKFLGLVLLLCLIFLLPVFILMILIGIAAYFGTVSNFGLAVIFAILAIIGFISYFIFLIYFGTKWIFSVYILIGENKGVTDSIRSSGKLVKGRWWKTFGYSLLFGLIIIGIYIIFFVVNYAITLGITVGAGLPAASTNTNDISSLSTTFSNITILTMTINLIFGMLSQIIIVPLSALLIKNFYFSWKSSKK